MESTPTPEPRFPRGLLEWAGNHAGGVKRLFDETSGRPAKNLLRTHLISKLESWAKDVASAKAGTPRILLLVGGPGNGKTEAIEHTIKCLDDQLRAGQELVRELSRSFLPPPGGGQGVDRVVQADTQGIPGVKHRLRLSIVQDASATSGHPGSSAPALLIGELAALLGGNGEQHYLCCVNRGVLDDALIGALEQGQEVVGNLLEAIAESVSLSSSAPPCWPLQDFAEVAVWPMDMESLLVSPGEGVPAPAVELMSYAVAPDAWSPPGTCPAKEHCPFCGSQAVLAHEGPRGDLLQILRWYELASGKRWSFRDLFSLVAHLLAGTRLGVQDRNKDPCRWAASLLEQDKAPKPTRESTTALFRLVGSLYQHALFHRWDPDAAKILKESLALLDLPATTSEARTLQGLQAFLQSRKNPYLPATIAPVLDDVASLLDPALASPGLSVALGVKRTETLGDIDARFSLSVGEGHKFVGTSRRLSRLEDELLGRLAKADNLLSEPKVRRASPTAASNIQYILRDFACRLARRSLCAYSAIVADAPVLQEFQQVVDDVGGGSLNNVAQQVKALLNNAQAFEVSLTTTFGQPLPPRHRQATLSVLPRLVRRLLMPEIGRPRSPIRFLEVGSGVSRKPIPLTYDLFKAVKDLDRGLSVAALPGSVVALLDTTRAKLSGPIVRDDEALTDARIRIGIDGPAVGLDYDSKFVAVRA